MQIHGRNVYKGECSPHSRLIRRFFGGDAESIPMLSGPEMSLVLPSANGLSSAVRWLANGSLGFALMSIAGTVELSDTFREQNALDAKGSLIAQYATTATARQTRLAHL